MAKLTSEVVERVLRATHGNIAAAAKKLGVTRRAIEYRVETTPGLAEVVKDARETIVDDAEAALGKAVRAGEPWAIALTLKTQGKGRGYVERHEQTGKDGKDLVPLPPDFWQRLQSRPTEADPIEERLNTRNGKH